MYVSEQERPILDKSLNNFDGLSSTEHEQLVSIDLRIAWNANKSKKSTSKRQIITMTRNELFFKPEPFIELMMMGLPAIHVETFWSLPNRQAIENLFLQAAATSYCRQSLFDII